jgi:hypothetical protein
MSQDEDKSTNGNKLDVVKEDEGLIAEAPRGGMERGISSPTISNSAADEAIRFIKKNKYKFRQMLIIQWSIKITILYFLLIQVWFTDMRRPEESNRIPIILFFILFWERRNKHK